jgi:hypothetical protein
LGFQNCAAFCGHDLTGKHAGKNLGVLVVAGSQPNFSDVEEFWGVGFEESSISNEKYLAITI